MSTASPVATPTLPRQLSRDQVAQLADEMIAGWKVGEPPDARVFLERHPELAEDKDLVVDLAFEEFMFRVDRKERLNLREFAGRFPFPSSVFTFLCANTFTAAQKELLPELPPWLQAGIEFGGFSLLRQLGQGGLARVFLAEETALGNRLVVVKIAPGGETEASFLGQLRDPGVVPIYSLSKEPDTGLTITCMPFLGTSTLCDVLDHAFRGADYPESARVILQASAVGQLAHLIEPGPGPDRILKSGSYVEGVIHLGIQIAHALDVVHDLGILHRDLKPSNVLLSPAGRPLLLDFNLSSDDHGNGELRGGTPLYMAPEQLAGCDRQCSNPPPVDGRADLYALGAILFELLTGKNPCGDFPADMSQQETVAYFRERLTRPLLSLRGTFPRSSTEGRLAAVIERCLQRDPADRFATAADLEKALRRCLTPVKRMCRWASSHRWLVSAALAVVVMLTLLAGVYGASRKERLFASGRAYQKLAEESGLEAHWQAAVNEYQASDPDGLDGRTQACIAYCSSQVGHRHDPDITFRYEKAINKGFDTAVVRNNLGYGWLHQHGRLDDAFKRLLLATQQDPTLAAAFHNLAHADRLIAMNRKHHIPDNGMTAISTATILEPNDWSHWQEAAYVFTVAAKNTEKAMEDLKDATKKKEKGESLLSLKEEVFRSLNKMIDLGVDPKDITKDVFLKKAWATEKEFQDLLGRQPNLPAAAPGPLTLDPGL